jgi:two-component system, sensor histidine kinase and response regulator
MPILSGLETVKRLRARGYDTLPIVVMSATAHAEQCQEAGATDFIEKPFHLDDVLDCLERHID